MNPELLQWMIPVATVAAAWGGSRQALNGTRERVRSIETKIDSHTIQTASNFLDITTRVAVVETKVDDIKEKINV